MAVLSRTGWPVYLGEESHFQSCIHAPTREARHRILGALIDGQEKPHGRWARQIASCGTGAKFYIDQVQKRVRPWIHRCKNRMCPFCGKKRSADTSARIEEHVLHYNHPRHIVLTVKSVDKPLREQLDTMRRWFGKLRRLKAFKDRVIRGIYAIEVTMNEKTHLWHPHVHIIYDGMYFPFKLLQRLWHEVTGASEIVYIGDVTDRPGMAKEISKYCGKPAKLSLLTDEQIRNYAAAVSGLRMIQDFGKKLAKPVTDEIKDEQPERGEYAISLSRVVWLAENGWIEAQRLAVLIARTTPMFATYIWERMPQLSPADSPVTALKKHMALVRGQARPRAMPPGLADTTPETAADLYKAFTVFQEADEAGKFNSSSERLLLGIGDVVEEVAT